jgi:hypothetical protein
MPAAGAAFMFVVSIGMGAGSTAGAGAIAAVSVAVSVVVVVSLPQEAANRPKARAKAPSFTSFIISVFGVGLTFIRYFGKGNPAFEKIFFAAFRLPTANARLPTLSSTKGYF